MNYIILDMEWDNAYCRKCGRFVNQILQIGAVKLDGELNICDTLEINVKSSFSKKVSSRFTALTGITTDDMLSGISYEEAIKKFNEWAGNDTITLTWSNSDLYTLIQNEEFLPKGVALNIERYMDLQKYIQNEMRLIGLENDGQISLANAAEKLGITTEGLELHTAKDDSLLCAALLKKFYSAERIKNYIKDATAPDFYARLRYKPYYIDDISNPLVKREYLRFECEECCVQLKRTSKWHFNNRSFVADFYCSKCKKRFVGRVSVRKNYDDVAVKRNIREKKRKPKEVENNEMQSLPETV